MRVVKAIALWGLANGCVGGPITDDWSGDDFEGPGVGNLIVNPCGSDFGVLKVGEEGFAAVRLQNAGEQPISVSSLALEAPFSVAVEFPIEVAAGSSRQVTVQFAPGAAEFGAFESTLIVTSDDPDSPEIECILMAGITKDADGDNHDAVEAGGDDCNDEDPMIHPSAEEIWYDGIDQDCSGTSDYDQDGDGYESKVFNDAVDPDCDPTTEICGGDCQDVYADINPGVEEVWYDGVDADCSGGSDWDFDGDGYRSAEYGWEDCDDTDARIYPASEEALDRIDNNCNGATDEDISPETADVIGIGDDDGDGSGNAITIADLNDNGIPDLIFGIHRFDYKGGSEWTEGLGAGGVAIFSDNGLDDFDNLSEDADFFIEGDKSTDEFGHAVVTIGDYDDDGVTDIAVGSRGHSGLKGRVYVFSGAGIDTTTDPNDADLIITGNNKHQIGQGLASDTDLNGDGTYDLIMYGTDAYIAYTYLGVQYMSPSESGSVSWSSVDSTWRNKCGYYYSTTSRGYCGPYISYGASSGDIGGTDSWYYNAHGGGDLDGDGYHDLAISEPNNDQTYTNAGATFVLWGRSTQFTRSAGNFATDASRVTTGKKYNDYFGGLAGLSPDVDGDGSNELWVHDKGDSKLYFYLGGSRSGYGQSNADAVFKGVGGALTAVTNAGDWDGDGIDDIGLSFSGSGASGGEYVLLPSKAYTGSALKLEDHHLGNIGGMDYNNAFGMGAAHQAHDLDGNGTSDLLLGDLGYDEDEDEEAEGAVYLIYQPL